MTEPDDVTLDLFLMDCHRTESTGVDGAVIWLSADEPSNAGRPQGPRVWVALGAEISLEALKQAASISLTEPPIVQGELPSTVQDQAIAFVRRNRRVLLRYWKGSIDTPEMLRRLSTK